MAAARTPTPSRRVLFIALCVSLGLSLAPPVWAAAPEAGALPAAPSRAPERVVSINPSLTAILIALGAADLLVGVDDYSAQSLEEVAHLPRVGGLFSPSLEAVVALRPELVVLVPSAEQREFRQRLEALGVRVVAFENIHFDQVLENISRLGALTHREEQARDRVAAIERMRRTSAKVTAGRPGPRVLLVLQRDPIFVVGSGSFIEEMIRVLGADNIAAEFTDPYPRVAVEWVVAQAPEVVIDLSPDPADPVSYWAQWPSIPAVERGRVLRVDAALVSMPGPYLDRSLEVLAKGLYGAEIVSEIERELSR